MEKEEIPSQLSDVPIPKEYIGYYDNLIKNTLQAFEASAHAKASMADSSSLVEPKIAYGLADRVSKMHDIDISEPLLSTLRTTSKELAALKFAGEIAEGKHSTEESLEKRLDLAVRVGLAIVTEGVTIAPLQGISDVKIKTNSDNTQYLSVSFAGPIRSAGGTEAASTMLIADHVRKKAGLSSYIANSFDDETGRFIEELRIYEREVGSFQYHVLDEDVVKVITNLSVELDGIDTDPVEIVSHRNMARIATNRVRGGALRVLNDGLIGRSRKLLSLISTFQMEGWDWLNDLKGAIQKGNEDAATQRMREVITGRSVLSMAKKLGGFRLRYGRACNTGFATVGIHPVVAEILDHTIAVGTQIKLDLPGKAATVAFVDSIDTPTVRLKNGDVVKIKDVSHGMSIKNHIEKILHLGDILISYGDFLENNAQLVPTPYVEEYWKEELSQTLQKYEPADKNLQGFLTQEPTIDEAIKLSLDFSIPLHPRYLFYWDQLTIPEFKQLLGPVSAPQQDKILYSMETKPVLEKLGVPHRIISSEQPQKQMVLLEDEQSEIFFNLLFRNGAITPEQLDENESDSVPQIISKHSGIRIANKFSTSIGVRVGRPEKAALRKMKPPVHVLFPVGTKGGPSRDLVTACRQPNFFCSITNRRCDKCQQPSISIVCNVCGTKTSSFYLCIVCRSEMDEDYCHKCKRRTNSFSYKPFPLKQKLNLAQEVTGIPVESPFKGVKELINQDKIPEPLEKGLIRQTLDLYAFKDGTIRYDATNAPLTHFKPEWVGVSVQKLHTLGYTKDMDGNPLTSEDQILELKVQDVIIPYDCGDYLFRTSQFIDKELDKLYKKTPHYNLQGPDDIIGHLIIGLAPHTSVGVVGRVIGFTDTNVCYGSPTWHSAKRRDADGDADSVMLVQDALLNFSRRFLSERIGGLMDAPLLIQPVVIPQEVQRQAHNLEVTKKFELPFYECTLEEKKASEAANLVEILKSRIETESQFYDYHFTNHTSRLTSSRPRSAYSKLGSVLEKLEMQIKTAEKINSVDSSEVVSMVMTTHLLPDIMGNLRAYAGQSFRCTSCGAAYRRVPLARNCLECGNKKLIQTLTRPSVEKYLKLSKRLLNKYEIPPYLRGRILALLDELELVFGREQEQSLLTDYS